MFYPLPVPRASATRAPPPVPTQRKSKPKRARRPTPARLKKLLFTEWRFWGQGLTRVAGVDEVGRGPLAGPVVAAAVILPPDCWIDGVDDSKKLTPRMRADLYGRIVSSCLCYGVGAASAGEIDRLNIRRATALAMQRALARLRERPEHVLVDGRRVPELDFETHTGVVGGDAYVHCISAASILAKVVRDRLMDRLAARHPQYGWEHNRGYGTADHLAAIEAHGRTRHHRLSFQPAQFSLLEALEA
ncbi:MAG TPA: ribonuclease HII [Longimicrobiaceae bacterium]|nr:ribonuclease HII [Longimicrobiaceae bacterium]